MGGKFSRPSANGSRGSSSSSSHNNSNDCSAPCFGFLNPPHEDMLGSPMPDTPVLEKRRRLVETQQNENQKFVSTSYYGMEREGSRDDGALFLGPNNNNNNQTNGITASQHQTTITEGPNCERKLYQKYEILEVLGVGSTSTVHKCRNKQTNKLYAVKIIDINLMDEKFQGMMAQFQIEIEALRKLDHPGIIKLYDVYLTDTKIFIVMEYLEGGELFDYVVQKGTLTEEEASIIVKKVTSAVLFMHEHNIIHRDLKPENLLLVCQPRRNEPIDVKIIDFGLSKTLEMERPLASTFLGTRGYLAPEMLQRQDYTKAVDSWALGVIVFVLLCGCLPFDDDSAAISESELNSKFDLRFPRWAKGLSESAKDLLKKLLDINPATRFTAMQAYQHPWVQGKTANAKSLLASPARIQTPKSIRQARRKQAAAPSPENGVKKSQPQDAGFVAHVRKSSI